MKLVELFFGDASSTTGAFSSFGPPLGVTTMISNVPTIISKQSGVAEVLRHAIKVDFWDIDALADSIYALVNYPAISKIASEKGFEEVSTLKWNNAAAKMKAVYSDAINSTNN